MQSGKKLSECLRAGLSSRGKKNMVPSLRLLPCESSVFVKENPDKKYIYIITCPCLAIQTDADIAFSSCFDLIFILVNVFRNSF